MLLIAPVHVHLTANWDTFGGFCPSLGRHKHTIQNLLFPDGIVWSKENDDIEPLSKNEFLFTYGLKSGNCGQKESGQTSFLTNLSALAPQTVEMLNLWNDFRKVVDFIDENQGWLSRYLTE